MRDYLLFIDTETSGLPRSWDAPYADQDSWPASVQLAWVVYTKRGELVKKENHYISDQDYDMSPAALRIHGLTRDFLLQQGESRQAVMALLAADLDRYQPLVVAHYMQLDYHMVGADFYRLGLANPLDQLPVFCTMLATARYVPNPATRYLRLNRLYYLLFQRELENQHDALVDAQATAACFFEMLRLGDLDDRQISRQQPIHKNSSPQRRQPGCLLSFFASFLLMLLIFLWL